ncbi:MAG: hypothetical protein DMF58_16535 [Acidobacteria bacterium]|nr:MAG: hypothetical protein DMF58_16535 [Acidobacteriota bacterium]
MNMTADRVAMVAGASMPWMRMPGQSWLGAAAMFIAMWAVMMIAMMTPSLVPTLWRNRHRLAIAAGYFFVWILVGAAVYPIGVVVAFATMRWPALAHAVPLTAWKARQLQACRSPECAKNPWRHGLRLGLRCTLCCSGLMSILLVIGVMNLVAMGVVTTAITAERLAPKPQIISRVIGVAAIVAGAVISYA